MIRRLRSAYHSVLFYSIYILGPWLSLPVDAVTHIHSRLGETRAFRALSRQTERFYGVCAGRNTTSKIWSRAEMIGGLTGFESSAAQLGADSHANAIALIIQADSDGRDRLWANNYSARTGWNQAELIDAVDNEDSDGGDDNDIVEPTITFDHRGNALAVWHRHDSFSNTNYSTWARHYTAGTGWGNVAQLDLKPYDRKTPAKTACDTYGNVHVLWSHQKRGTANYTILAKNYSPESGWSDATQIASGTGHARIVMINFDSQGNVHGLWQQSGIKTKSDAPHTFNILASRYTVAIGWSAAVLIAKDVEDRSTLRMAFDHDDNAFAVWEQPMGDSEDKGSNIWANRYIAGIGWGTAVSIEPDTSLIDSRDPQIVCNRQGGAIVVWRQNQYGHNSFWVNRFTAAAGWGAAKIFLPDTHGEAHSRAALDAEGNAIVIWLQREKFGNYTVWARHFNVETGWNAAARISRKSDNAYFSTPELVVDPRGNALAVWTSSSRFNKISVNYYTANKGWGIATWINKLDTTGTLGDPQIALHTSDISHVLWLQGVHRKIWSSRLG